ncbi:MAG: hypothetical protein M1818_004513 [Claussenomyces sp. TS43310]|nr:MAG: hypothetical protein M1818_004513 [Claussenomyces sp. TS43310]
MAFVKVSIGLTLLRICVQRRYIWIIKITMIIVVLWTIGIFMFNIFQCWPVRAQWDFRLGVDKCVPGSMVVHAAYAFSVMAVISDWLFALLPIPMLWNVKMNIQAKISVTVILSLGILPTCSSRPFGSALYGILFYTPPKLLVPSQLTSVNPKDTATDALLWTIMEPALGIVAASMTTLRPLLRAMHIAGFSSYSGNSGDPSKNGFVRSGQRLTVLSHGGIEVERSQQKDSNTVVEQGTPTERGSVSDSEDFILATGPDGLGGGAHRLGITTSCHA